MNPRLIAPTLAPVLAPLLAVGLLAACDRPGPAFGASPLVNASVIPGQGGAASAVANQACIGAGAKAFDRPWQTIVLGGSRGTSKGNFQVQIISGRDGVHAICTVTSAGRVLRLEPT